MGFLEDLASGAQKVVGGAINTAVDVGKDLVTGTNAQHVFGDVSSAFTSGTREVVNTGINVVNDATNRVNEANQINAEYFKPATDWASGSAETVARGAFAVAAPIVVPAAVIAMGAAALWDYGTKAKPNTSGQGGNEYDSEGLAVGVGGSDNWDEFGTAIPNTPTKTSKQDKKDPDYVEGVSATGTEGSGTTMSTADLNEFKANYKEENITRSDYTKIADLGLDRETWKLIANGDSPLEAVTKRLEVETKPKLRRELDWQQGKLLQNEIAASSAEHSYKKTSEKASDWTPNSRENVGDMALAIKLGTRQEGKLQVSKSNPGALGVMQALPEEGYIPGGMGWDDITWKNAGVDGYNKKSPSLLPAIKILEDARDARDKNNDLGIYGTLTVKPSATQWNPLIDKTYTAPAQMRDVNGNVKDIIPWGLNKGDKTKALKLLKNAKSNPWSNGTDADTIYLGPGRETIAPRNYVPGDSNYEKGSASTLGINPDPNHEYDNVGTFGSKSKMRKSKSTVHHKKPLKPVCLTELDVLKSFGITQPFRKTGKNPLGQDVKYTTGKGSFQTMRKKPVYKVSNDLEDLRNSGILGNVSKPKLTKKTTKKPVTAKKNKEYGFWGI